MTTVSPGPVEPLGTLVGDRVETLPVLSNVMEWLGIGATYLWRENFSGWSVRGDVRLKLKSRSGAPPVLAWGLDGGEAGPERVLG